MVSLVGISTPVFWLGLMLIVVFSVWLGWLPVGGYGEHGSLRYLILPAVSLSSMSWMVGGAVPVITITMCFPGHIVVAICHPLSSTARHRPAWLTIR